MKRTPRQYTEALIETLEKNQKNSSKEIIHRFALMLGKNHATSLLPKISKELERLTRKSDGVTKLVAADAETLKIAERETGFTEGTIDTTLIAGTQITRASLRVDTSVKRRLETTN